MSNILEVKLNNLYNNYKFLYTKEEYDQIINNIRNEKVVSLEEIINLLNKKIKEDLEDINTGYLLMIKVFRKIIYNSFNYINAVYNLQKVATFWQRFLIKPDQEVILKVLKGTPNLVKAIEKCYYTNKEGIDKNIFPKELEDKAIISLINTYLESFNIEDKKIKKENIKSIYKVYLEDIMPYPPLSKEEEKELLIKVKNKDKCAREVFIIHNLRLTKSIANRYIGFGLDINDLIEEGNIGLIKAVDYFDITKNNRFSTYAVWWIRNYIERAIINNNMLFKREDAANLFYFRRKLERLKKEEGSPLTIDIISEKLNIDKEEVKRLLSDLEEPLSLDDNIEDTTDGNLKQVRNEVLLKQIFKRARYFNLLPREEIVILLRFGLYDGNIYTYQKIANIFNITKERARQIEDNGLKKLYMGANKKLASERKYKRKTKAKYINIEEYLGCSKEELNNLISKLKDHEKTFFYTLFGPNLDIPYPNDKWSMEQLEFFQKSFIITLRRIIKNPNIIRYKDTIPEYLQEDNFNENISDVIIDIYNNNYDFLDILKMSISKGVVFLLSKGFFNNRYYLQEELNSFLNISLDNINSNLKCEDLLNYLFIREFIIVSLYLGYVNGYNYSTKDIALFLNIREIDVNIALERAINKINERNKELLIRKK